MISPHIHGGRSTSRIMTDVLIALIPATVAGCVIFGARALLPIFTCIICSVGFEALFNLITKREQTVGDMSAAVTGLLLALNLPANVPVWQCAIGSLFAIIVVKQLYGGLGKNFLNPALAGRCFMLIAWAGTLTTFAPAACIRMMLPGSSFCASF